MDPEVTNPFIAFLPLIILLPFGLAIIYFTIKFLMAPFPGLRAKWERMIQRKRRPEAEKKRLQQRERQKHDDITED